LTPTAAGAIGTYWLAAHEVTHGGPFGRLRAIPIGALARITTTADQTFVYTVTSLQVVGTTAAYATVYGADPTARLILLQTCLDTGSSSTACSPQIAEVPASHRPSSDARTGSHPPAPVPSR
jgi:sortase (surface protein transpeptidase)